MAASPIPIFFRLWLRRWDRKNGTRSQSDCLPHGTRSDSSLGREELLPQGAKVKRLLRGLRTKGEEDETRRPGGNYELRAADFTGSILAFTDQAWPDSLANSPMTSPGEARQSRSRLDARTRNRTAPIVLADYAICCRQSPFERRISIRQMLRSLRKIRQDEDGRCSPPNACHRCRSRNASLDAVVCSSGSVLPG